MKTARPWVSLAVPAGAIFFVGLLTLFGVTRTLELQIMDFYTHLIPSPPEKSEVVLIDVDDEAMQNVGTWPWSRDVHAELLADLRSLGAESLSFDVEFVDRGPVGVNAAERDALLTSMTGELDGVVSQWKDKMATAEESFDIARELVREGILLTARDNDAYLGQAMKVFGRAFTTLNYDQDSTSDDAMKAQAWLRENSGLPNVTGNLDHVKLIPKARGAIVPIAEKAAAAAVTNVEKDEDGTLRRINLLFRLKDTDLVFGQLAFVPVWTKLGKPSIEVQPDRIVLKTSTLAENPRPDLVIPLDPSGRLVINWPHDLYWNTFTHVRVSELQRLRLAQAELVKQVVAMQQNNYFEQDVTGLFEQAVQGRKDALLAEDQAAFDASAEAAAAWRDTVSELANGPSEQRLKDGVSATADDPKVPQFAKDAIPEKLSEITSTFTALRNKTEAYLAMRDGLAKRLKGALCFYGWTAVATTDLGVTPFDPVYYNVGTHASIANTLLSGAFLNEWPSWLSFVLGALLAILAAFFQTRSSTSTLSGVVIGFGIFAVLVLVVGVGYALTGVYAGALTAGSTVFITVLGLTLVRFWGSEAEKRYIRGAFSTYLSPDVIKQLEADPDKLKLGGEKKTLTAMFTDVKGFSTVSESMDPNDLVTLLNHYLTGMSDLVLDTRGTIDKFEGDAIIAFWGAPLHFEDHAQLAAQTALRMKKAELTMNERFLSEKLAPTPLLTRIGINTGEMTVGNMGTSRRMDYTMMGNAVNLAARLEGVNKQYGTWILTSQSTRDRLDDTIVVRKLDRVRVVGISTPVRLYEINSFRADATDKTLQKIGLFEQGIDAYEAKEWDKARGLFHEVLSLDPHDGPAKTFLERTQQIQENPPQGEWDGVFSLTSK